MQPGCKWLLISVALLASFGLAGLALWPQQDLAFSTLFLAGPRSFAVFPHLRPIGAWLPYGVLLVSLVVLVKAGPPALGRKVLFLVLSFALGPGLLVNGILKTTFHRPRPVHVQAFGGDAAFQPFYRLPGDCPRNCSFPSGEAAGAFWTLAPALLVPAPLQTLCVAAALLFGAMTGLLRIGAGAHFLSDVLFSGLMMVGLICGLFVWLRPHRGGAGDLSPLDSCDLNSHDSDLHEEAASL